MESDSSIEGEQLNEAMEHDGSQGESSRFTWPKSMDRFLLEVLREQKVKGLKDDRNFQAEAYRIAVEAINNKFKCKINKDKVVNRLKTLKEQFYLVLEALKKSGISWNDSTKKVKAGSQVWAELIKVKPRFSRIRDKEIPNLEILREIYEKDRADGTHSTTAKERMRQWNEEMNTVSDVDRLLDENVVILENVDNFNANSPVGSSAPPPPKSVKRSTSKLKVKRKFEEIESEAHSTLEDGLRSVTKCMSDMAQALKVANENFMKSKHKFYSTSEIYAELEKFGLSGVKLLKVAQFLTKNNEEAGLFFDCPDNLKAEWLQLNGF